MVRVAIADDAPDIRLLVLDLSMPVMSGLEALPHVLRASPSTGVVVLSGFSASVGLLTRRGQTGRPDSV
ncbi:response regulator transcription factor [Nocardioides marmoribigeumensis]|jgi:YesN/AraC family two-component response regulator|uniref:YesN/AraC family two-component response regulator n=1 Tax=Nocardioides marmoribigeumensis TaxID=433649 RepID=A0ABU2BZ29_9ACTN|nr:hypothetical protein [Nocardioides marmoribigeumensis]MDR7363660.1 YesN/AraC family two-component response regulator [Nocardioides marmoribigeumensis]